MLADYDVGPPHGFFDFFLLKSKSEMQRLHFTENYLSIRRKKTIYPAEGIFKDYGHSHSFAVRYFQQSQSLQQLRSQIEADPQSISNHKRKELAEKGTAYSRLIHLYDESECKYKEGYNKRGQWYHRHNAQRCKKFKYKKAADQLSIEVHEWPLPSSNLQVSNVVFEPQLPISFDFWRQTTLFVWLDIFENKYTSDIYTERNLYHVLEYQDLRKYAPSSAVRFGLNSEVKPHTKSHYHHKEISLVTEEDIFPKNGMQLRYFDRNGKVFVDHLHFTNEAAKKGNYKLSAPVSAYKIFMFRPPPNKVVASQSDCPAHISLNEYKSLASVPLGYRIQWQNILVQLAMPAVDCRKQELAIIMAQTIYQAGPASDEHVLRVGHLVIEDIKFVGNLQDHLQEAIE